jgi:hypothetical protein
MGPTIASRSSFRRRVHESVRTYGPVYDNTIPRIRSHARYAGATRRVDSYWRCLCGSATGESRVRAED